MGSLRTFRISGADLLAKNGLVVAVLLGGGCCLGFRV